MVAWAWCPVLHLLLLAGTWSWAGGGVEALTTLKIGALLAFNSTIGQVALAALQEAVLDVNDDPSILPNHELLLEAVDTSCNAFQGDAAAVKVWKEDVLAVAGPQTSLMAQFAADVGAATQVPVVSFAATDPALTKTRNRYFLRTAHSDAVQMKTLAALIGFYGWRGVSAISTNDYVGRNSLEALSEALDLLDINLLNKTTIPPDASAREIVIALNGLAMYESRVIVVHLQPSVGRLLFTTALSMKMMTTGFVWLMSEAMSSLLEDMSPSDPLWTAIQGVVAVRSYVPPSSQLRALQSRWNTPKFTDSSTPAAAKHLNIYGLYAYDTLWVIAQAMDDWIRSGKGFSFVPRAALTAEPGEGTDLAGLKILKDGDSFLKSIRDTRFVGTSGLIEFDSDGDLVGSNSFYEILNFIGKGFRVVGFWNADQGFSQVLKSNYPVDGPTSPHSKVVTENPGQLQDVVWPGGSAQVPKGRVGTRQMLIGVPFKREFTEFVSIVTNSSNVTTVRGFCTEVFEAAVKNLAYPVNFTYVVYGDGTSTPHYENLVDQVVNKRFDGAVGDISLTLNRSKVVDFTQPFTASGLAVVVPTKAGGSNQAWAFMRPFSPELWIVIGVFFLLTGLTTWILERKENEDFGGGLKKQIITVLWFMFSTLFFIQRERTKSILGKVVLTIWIFVAFIVLSSYQASLTSILTVQQLVPTVKGIDGLVSSNLKIGYQTGSFTEDYLLHQRNVPSNRLVPLEGPSGYENALATGLVGGVVDEHPYLRMFLSNDCSFKIVGHEFTKGGWAFAFPKGSQVAVDLSRALEQMVEDGTLQEIYDYWLSAENCDASGGISVNPNVLGVSTFWGLFLLTGVASVFCLILYYARLGWQHLMDYVANVFTRSSRNKRNNFSSGSLVEFTEQKRGYETGKEGCDLEQQSFAKKQKICTL